MKVLSDFRNCIGLSWQGNLAVYRQELFFHAGGNGAIPLGLPALLMDLAEVPAIATSAEALAALQPLASAQLATVRGRWSRLQVVILRHLESEPAAGSPADAAGKEDSTTR
jgi:hypothetical protein